MKEVYHKDMGQGVVVESNDGKSKVKFAESGITKDVNESDLRQVLHD